MKIILSFQSRLNPSIFHIVFIALIAGLAGCQWVSTEQGVVDHERLTQVISARTDSDKARDVFRHPAETLAFFGVAPNMTVLEVLPGGGWYTRILAPYLAETGVLHGVNYADATWDLFGFLSADFVNERKQQMINWAEFVESSGGNATKVMGATFGQLPASWDNQVDIVVMVRALHNLNRFESQANTRTQAIADLYRVLKPGGILGVVQHRAPESASDEWASGKNGYLKTSAVIKMFSDAGFKWVASSEMNANINDKPTEADVVWRLPPSLARHADDNSRTAAKAVGESDRMTLKFVKE